MNSWDILLAMLLAVGLDWWLGEPQRWHPLVGFGRIAMSVEKMLNNRSVLRGIVAWMLVVLPWVGVAYWLHAFAPRVVDVLLLYFALGARSLLEHAEAIARPLVRGDLTMAREQLSRIVSRDTSSLGEEEIAKGAVESVLENGHDAIFGALFWFVLGAFTIGSGPAVLLFRLANTLDAMWGYRTERFNCFGRFSARCDDVLGYVSSRLTALTYTLLGQTRLALTCWRRQAPLWDSPNAGPVMAAGAGSLGVLLGGAAIYHGQVEHRPVLGARRLPVENDIFRATRLLYRGIALWLASLAVVLWLVLSI